MPTHAQASHDISCPWGAEEIYVLFLAPLANCIWTTSPIGPLSTYIHRQGSGLGKAAHVMAIVANFGPWPAPRGSMYYRNRISIARITNYICIPLVAARWSCGNALADACSGSPLALAPQLSLYVSLISYTSKLMNSWQVLILSMHLLLLSLCAGYRPVC